MRNRYKGWFTLAFGAALAFQGLRAVAYAYLGRKSVWGLIWLAAAAMYALLAYGAWLIFTSRYRSKNSN